MSNGEKLPLLNNNDNDNINYSKPYNSFNGRNGVKDESYILDFSNGNGTPDKEKKVKSLNRSFSEENITYTWSQINVFSEKDKRKSSKFSKCLSIFKNDNKPSAPQRKHILQNVSGVAYPNELLAIMGSSGAGKTTLLNTLTFRSSANMVVTGSRAVNGNRINSTTLSSVSAYVQQDDLFFANLTVREHLIFQALVRMDKNIPYHQRMLRVEQVISELLLTSCQNTLIGKPGRVKGISGGEMKRLSFASEVLTNPPIMFCDEPTSGLDSFMAQTVITVLKTMADKGKTIICTIHQPSSEVYAMFDKILLMAEGKTAFLGSPTQASTFFGSLGLPCPTNHNPADFFIETLAVIPSQEEECRKRIRNVCDRYEKSEYFKLISARLQFFEEQNKGVQNNGWMENGSIRKRSPYKASWWAQFKAVSWRSWLTMKKEPAFTRVRLMQTLMVALIMSIIYFGQQITQDGVMNINGALFLCLTNMTFQNALSVVNVFCSDLPVFLREHFNGMYRTDVYFLCKTMAELPMLLLMASLFTAVIYYTVGLNPLPVHFFYALVIIVLVATVSASFGYLISCVSPSTTVALSIGPPLIIPFLLFGGFYLNVSSIPSYFVWLSYFSWFKYGMEALYINQWADVKYIECDQPDNSTCYSNGHVILQAYSFKEENFSTDLLALVGLVVLFRVLAFVGLFSHTCRK